MMNPEEKRKESRDESDTYTPEQLRLMAEIKQAVNYLQQSGLDGAVVRKALLSFDDLCGLLVTADYRVMLCSPSLQEVKMGTLPKTVSHGTILEQLVQSTAQRDRILGGHHNA